jgi:hypothetical protein
MTDRINRAPPLFRRAVEMLTMAEYKDWLQQDSAKAPHRSATPSQSKTAPAKAACPKFTVAPLRV